MQSLLIKKSQDSNHVNGKGKTKQVMDQSVEHLNLAREKGKRQFQIKMSIVFLPRKLSSNIALSSLAISSHKDRKVNLRIL